jgi:hypothetical protein
MALEAKDFQNQAQWALVAIPAPIYFALIFFVIPICTNTSSLYS